MNGSDVADMLLKNLNSALKSKKLYPQGHPAIAAPVKKSFELLSRELRQANNVVIAVVEDTLTYEDELIENGDKAYPEIMGYMKERNVDAIIFEKGSTEKELAGLIDVLSSEGKLTGNDLQKQLHAMKIIHITLKSIPMGRENIMEIYNGAVEVVKNVMGEVRMGKLPKSGPINEIIDEISETVFSDPNAIIGLTMIKNYDNYLYNHSVNVSIMSLSLAKALGLDKDAIHAVGVGALLHDVGKTGVSENIIRKPSGLSSEEWEKVKEHPVLGSKIIQRMDGLDESVGRVIYEHHVKYDHSGYPQTSDELHPLSQIVTICDAYDALTTLRVYQKPHSPVEAVKVMSNFSGRHFNPETLKAFINMLGLYPIGTMVRLSSNEIAIVTGHNPDAEDRPMVKIVYGSEGDRLDEPVEADLHAETERAIVATVNPATTEIDMALFFEKEGSSKAVA